MAGGGGAGEDGPHKGVCAPEGMADGLAAAEVHHLKAKVAKPVVRLKQSGVRVSTVELGREEGGGVRVCV